MTAGWFILMRRHGFAAVYLVFRRVVSATYDRPFPAAMFPVCVAGGRTPRVLVRFIPVAYGIVLLLQLAACSRIRSERRLSIEARSVLAHLCLPTYRLVIGETRCCSAAEACNEGRLRQFFLQRPCATNAIL